ncbi:MAG: pyridine nucleotide-disulfide oxidoreductase [Deltaproteobacteria bacterium SG8_13]|nr:MAG: pyridine nucleotide-disulfide oxidoreductase [Deltaproteobacteria bacterium SG8_13]
MKNRLVIAGGGHAHMVTLANLHRFVEKGCSVTVVGPSEHHYYSGMGPGMLGKTYTPEQIRFATKFVVEKKGGTFVLGKVVRIDAREQVVHVDSGDRIPYDVLSCNLGSQVPKDFIEDGLEDIYLVKPIERLLAAQQRILELGRRQKLTIGIIGGGPSAVEIAGNLWRLTREPGLQPAKISILTSDTLMPHHPAGVRAKARFSLKRRGIEVVEGCRVHKIRAGQVTETSGKTHDLDIIFVAIGVKPSPVFAASGLPVGPDGGLLVNRYLQSVAHENIFGGGDCIYFKESPLDKVGVYAVRQNPVIYHNLMATLDTGPLQPFEPGGAYLLIFNLGDGTGIFHKWWLLFGGRLAFTIKDYVDRRFMKTFQALEQ